MKNRGLGFKLSLGILSAVILIIGGLVYSNYKVSKSLLLKNVEENAKNLTHASTLKILNYLNALQEIPENAAYVMQEFDISDEVLMRYLRMVVENNEEVFGVCIAFEPNQYQPGVKYFAPYCFRSGDTLAFSNLISEEYLYQYQDWYQIPQVLDKAMWSDPYFDDGERLFRGVVTLDVSLEWLDKIVAGINYQGTGYPFLLSSSGTFIAHPNENFRMNESMFSLAEEHNMPWLRDIGKRMMKGENGFLEYISFYYQEHSYLYFEPMQQTSWSFGIVVRSKELFSDLENLNRRLLLVGIAGAVLLLILIIVISNRITMPLVRLARATDAIGKGYFDFPLPAIKSRDEIGRLTRSVEIMQKALKQYISDLKETTAAREKIESELMIARDIQQGIIPKIFPPFPERVDVDLYAVLDPAREVGGDLYDFFFLDKDLLCFCIGDVSGKGVPSSLFMAITRTLLHAKSAKNMPVEEIVVNMNYELCKGNINNMFVTFFLGIIDLESGKLDYCNAGHNYPYIIRQCNDLECIDQTHGVPLGIFNDIEYGHGSIVMNDGDSMVLYTDGVTEAINLEEELYDEDRLEKFLKAHCGSDPKKITSDLVIDVKEFVGKAEQSDDITILSLAYYNDQENAGMVMAKEKSITLTNKIDEIRRLSEFIESICEEWSVEPTIKMNLDLVLEEVLSNIINYAFTDKDPHEIQVNFFRKKDTISIVVQDDGRQFDPISAAYPDSLDKPAEDRNIGGLGIHFVKTLMDDVAYERRNYRNVLTMKKNI